MLDPHCQAHKDGEEIDGEGEGVGEEVFWGREVCDPEEAGEAEFDGAAEDDEEGEEDGDLDKHGEAAAHGVNFVFAVDSHHGLLLFLGVIFEFLAGGGDEGLDLLHTAGGEHGLVVQGPKNGSDEEGEEDDGEAVVIGPDFFFHPDHESEDEATDGAKEAEFEDILLMGAVGFEGGIEFGADVEGGGDGG